jgi:hypothetical protein
MELVESYIVGWAARLSKPVSQGANNHKFSKFHGRMSPVERNYNSNLLAQCHNNRQQ